MGELWKLYFFPELSHVRDRGGEGREVAVS
jgi:hypothetical protein